MDIRNSIMKVVLIFLLLFLSNISSIKADTIVFYIAPDGNDNWSGILERPNANETDGPFATIFRAQKSISQIPKGSAPIEVIVQEGLYYLNKPIIFSATDSGTLQAPVTIRAASGTIPIFSGGKLITNWVETTVKGIRAWETIIPQGEGLPENIRQLFVNGQRRNRTKLPKEGYYQFTGMPDLRPDMPFWEGQTRAQYATGDISENWHNINDIELVTLQLWAEARLPIAYIESASNTVHFTKQSIWRLTDASEPGATTPLSRFYVENVFEALDTVGQWYFDRNTRKLTYLPMPNEELFNTQVIFPTLDKLVSFEQGTSHLILQGLSFMHQEWELPADKSGSIQASFEVPAAVILQNTASCSIQCCTVSHIAGYAIELMSGCTDTKIVGCRLNDLGAGGIKVGHYTSSTTVSDCTITNGGILFHSAVGVWIGHSPHNRIIHNEIGYFHYTGISVGWSWGYNPSAAVDNWIEYNHIHHIGSQLLSDLGAIYTLGVSPDTRLTHNYIHDISAYRYSGLGIYLDEGSMYILVENNLVCRTKDGGFALHYGKENLVRNNIFYLVTDHQIYRTRSEEHLMFTFQNNIAVTDNGKMTKGIGSTNNIIFDYNIYFDIKNTALSFTGLSFEQWRSYGLDIHSLIADPKFINAEQGDFRLSPDSPAISLGFVPFDFREAGARCLSCSSTATPKPTSTPTSAPIKTSTPIPPTVTPSAPSVRTLTPTAILTATATNANSTQKPCKKGDTNCDLNITPGDALLAFQIYLLIYYPNGGEICDVLCSADYTGDNNITPGDALCIFREYLGNPC